MKTAVTRVTCPVIYRLILWKDGPLGSEGAAEKARFSARTDGEDPARGGQGASGGRGGQEARDQRPHDLRAWSQARWATVLGRRCGRKHPIRPSNRSLGRAGECSRCAQVPALSRTVRKLVSRAILRWLAGEDIEIARTTRLGFTRAAGRPPRRSSKSASYRQPTRSRRSS